MFYVEFLMFKLNKISQQFIWTVFCVVISLYYHDSRVFFSTFLDLYAPLGMVMVLYISNS